MARLQFPKNPAKDASGAVPQRASLDETAKTGIAPALARQLDKLAASPLVPGLYLVSTPIGNLSDISVRALFLLAAADMAICEDTRHSRKLLSAYGIQRKLEAYHDFSGERDRARILGALGDGKSVALISDAGTPLVADPGFKLVRAAIAEGFNVFPIPGPSAVLAALAASGLPTDQFFFGGFLPAKEGARRKELEAMRAVPGTLIFYESAGRLEETLEAMLAIFADRPIVIARELTKLHETVLRGNAAQLLKKIRENPPLGEFVILIGPGEAKPATEEDIEKALRNAMQSASLKEAVDEVAKGLGVGRKMVYNLALQLRKKKK
ncbi:MAG: 16S rRNA (cytidine(1402)-2'-O)-methyltransferase [Rhodomicrobium sp.]|nr:16S rRNA (cytidine(1402)-2'-O)-methyltransferase [Rhodomicrobium sp.]